MEYFELLREDGSKLGKIKERNQVHHDGDLHGGSHVWVVKRNAKGDYVVLLQKRRMDKDSFPGCFDVSCAGHMTAGEDFLSTALRELKEELNIDANEEQLHFLFSQKVEGRYVFHEKDFYNREINYIYLLEPSVSLESLRYQPEEIEGLEWVLMDELMEYVEKGNAQYCIVESELRGVYGYLEQLK